MRKLVVVLAGLAGTGCMSVTDIRSGAPASGGCQVGTQMVETMLYLGMDQPGGTVSRFDFNRFVETEVIPRWKEGFTILEAEGFWRLGDSTITDREDSRVLVRMHDGSAQASEGIEAIRNAYIQTFRQDAVLRTDTKTCADF